MKNKAIYRVCPVCCNKFETSQERISAGRGKYCSRNCSDKRTLFGTKPAWNKGLNGWTNKGSFRANHKQLNTGKTWWFTGEIRSENFINNHKQSVVKGEDHHAWKGEDAGYTAKHTYIKSHFGKANHCCLCGIKEESQRYEWASKAGYYSKNKKDYFPLCKSCHMRYDIIRNKLNIGNPRIYG